MDDDLTSLRKFWAVVATYTEDVAACLNALEDAEQNNPAAAATWRRLLARAILTVINQIPFRLMVHAKVKAAEGNQEILLARLTELSVKAKRGDLTGATKDAGGLVRSILFSFQRYADIHGSDYVVNMSDTDVALFDQIGIIDDALSLAWKPEDLMISDDTLEILYKAVGWMKKHWIALLHSCGQGVILDDSSSFIM